MNTEQITFEIQQMKATKAIKNGGLESAAPPSIADTTMTEEDGKSMAGQSESGVQTSQPPTSSPFNAGGEANKEAPKPRKTKRQLWDDVTISGKWHSPLSVLQITDMSYSCDAVLYFDIYPCITDNAHSGAT